MSKLHYVVTGASRGIGLELTRLALAAGHRVSALSRNPSERLQSLSKTHPEAFRSFRVDILSEDSIRAFAKELGEKDPIDVLINNAGILLDGSTAFEQISLEHVRESFDVNTIAPMRVTQVLLPWLKKSSHPKLINITSLMGSIADNNGWGHSYGYRMSKAALNMFTKTISVDFPEITAVVIHPGWVKTDMGGKDAPTATEESARGILKKISEVTKKNTGHFYDFEGDELPW